MGVYVHCVSKDELLAIMRAQLGEHWSCQMTEVKEPHGRLIDADYVHEMINWTYDKPPFSRKRVRRFVDDTPTVIESEGE